MNSFKKSNKSCKATVVLLTGLLVMPMALSTSSAIANTDSFLKASAVSHEQTIKLIGESFSIFNSQLVVDLETSEIDMNYFENVTYSAIVTTSQGNVLASITDATQAAPLDLGMISVYEPGTFTLTWTVKATVIESGETYFSEPRVATNSIAQQGFSLDSVNIGYLSRWEPEVSFNYSGRTGDHIGTMSSVSISWVVYNSDGAEISNSSVNGQPILITDSGVSSISYGFGQIGLSSKAFTPGNRTVFTAKPIYNFAHHGETMTFEYTQDNSILPTPKNFTHRAVINNILTWDYNILSQFANEDIDFIIAIRDSSGAIVKTETIEDSNLRSYTLTGTELPVGAYTAEINAVSDNYVSPVSTPVSFNYYHATLPQAPTGLRIADDSDAGKIIAWDTSQTDSDPTHVGNTPNYTYTVKLFTPKGDPVYRSNGQPFSVTTKATQLSMSTIPMGNYVLQVSATNAAGEGSIATFPFENLPQINPQWTEADWQAFREVETILTDEVFFVHHPDAVTKDMIAYINGYGFANWAVPNSDETGYEFTLSNGHGLIEGETYEIYYFTSHTQAERSTFVWSYTPEVPVDPEIAILSGVEVTQATLDAPPTITLPTTEGVVYTMEGEVEAGNSVTITATAKEGYKLAFPLSLHLPGSELAIDWTLSNDSLSATMTIVLDEAPEAEPIIAILPGIVITQATTDAPPIVTLPTTEGIVYTIAGEVQAGNTVTVTATAEEGYELNLPLMGRLLADPIVMTDWVLADNGRSATMTIALANAPTSDDNDGNGNNNGGGNGNSNGGGGSANDGSNNNSGNNNPTNASNGSTTTIVTTTTQSNDAAKSTDSQNASAGLFAGLLALLAGFFALSARRFKRNS